MWKKCGIVGLGLLLTVFTWGYWQIDKAYSQFESLLARHQISFRSVDLTLFPQPRLTIVEPQFQLENQPLLFKQVEWRFSPLALLKGQIAFQSINFDQGTFAQGNLHQLNLQLSDLHIPIQQIPSFLVWLRNPLQIDRTLNIDEFKLSVNAQIKQEPNPAQWDIEGKIAAHDGRLHLAKLDANIEFAHPLYLANRQFSLSLGKSTVEKIGENQYHFSLPYTQINQEFFDLRAVLSLVSPDGSSGQANQLDIKGYCQDCQALLIWEKKNHQISSTLSVNGFALESLFKAGKLPVLASGKLKGMATLAIQEGKLHRGEYRLESNKGKLIGLNLLQMVSQFLPIHYDEQALQQKDTETEFEQFKLHLRSEQQQLMLDEIYLRTPQLIASGEGKANLMEMQCDILLNLGVPDEKYQQFSLPIRFFERCDSPRYKIEITRDFRQQIKNLLKDKFR